MTDKATEKMTDKQTSPVEEQSEYQPGPAVSDIEQLHNQMHQARKGVRGGTSTTSAKTAVIKK